MVPLITGVFRGLEIEADAGRTGLDTLKDILSIYVQHAKFSVNYP